MDGDLIQYDTQMSRRKDHNLPWLPKAIWLKVETSIWMRRETI